MFIVGLDLGKRKSQACVGNQTGQVVAERRIATSCEDIAALCTEYRPARVLVEASTNSEWVARHMEKLGVEVIVADPRFGPMYAQLDKRIKTDRRDSRALMHALRLGAYREAHRRNDWARDLRARLLVRAGVVRSRARLVTQIRSLLDARGIKLAACAVERVCDKVVEAAVEPSISLVIEPLMAHLRALNELVEHSDEQLSEIAAGHAVARRLDEVVGVGPITALAFIVAVEDPTRFESARQVASYLGFVPRENSSGDRQHRGKTTKCGDSLARSYLVQASWRIMRSTSDDVSPLKAWAQSVEQRRGKKVAATALARRLVRILYAMWRDDRAYDAARLSANAIA